MSIPPNIIVNNNGAEDFYVSYNHRDISVYGTVTTAIVTQKQPDKFYILNGDHREQLKKKDLKACFEYFRQNIHLVSKNSDRVVNGKFIPRLFKGKFNEKGLDDGGVASFVFEVDQLVKGRIYEEQNPEYLQGGAKGVVIDDNCCWWHFGTPSFHDRFELVIPA